MVWRERGAGLLLVRGFCSAPDVGCAVEQRRQGRLAPSQEHSAHVCSAVARLKPALDTICEEGGIAHHVNRKPSEPSLSLTQSQNRQPNLPISQQNARLAFSPSVFFAILSELVSQQPSVRCSERSGVRDKPVAAARLQAAAVNPSGSGPTHNFPDASRIVRSCVPGAAATSM